MTTSRRPLQDYLAAEYPFRVIADPEGGYVVEYPDLPGCFTQVESLNELGAVADDARRLWMEVAYEQGLDIPPPSYPEPYSGKFNVRLPKSLHRSLAEAAELEGISLNQYVVSVLSAGTVYRNMVRMLANPVISDLLAARENGGGGTALPSFVRDPDAFVEEA